jgi:hypothetical protein
MRMFLAAVATVGCTQGAEPARAGNTGGAGSTGGGGSTSGGAGVGPTQGAGACVPQALTLPESGLGIIGTFNGLTAALGHVRAASHTSDENGVSQFVVSASSEPAFCGPNTFVISVATYEQDLLAGSYVCGPLPEEPFKSTYMYSLGNMTGTTPNGPAYCSVEITEAGTGPGALVAGTFEGSLVGAGYPLDVEGSFRVKLLE